MNRFIQIFIITNNNRNICVSTTRLAHYILSIIVPRRYSSSFAKQAGGLFRQTSNCGCLTKDVGLLRIVDPRELCKDLIVDADPPAPTVFHPETILYVDESCFMTGRSETLDGIVSGARLTHRHLHLEPRSVQLHSSSSF